MGAENRAPQVQNSSSAAVMNGLYHVKQITQFVWASISVSKESSSSLPGSLIKLGPCEGPRRTGWGSVPTGRTCSVILGILTTAVSPPMCGMAGR